MSCATRRASQNQNLDLDQRECICLLNHKSYTHEKVVTLLEGIPELTAQQDDLYFAGLQFLKCITNRRLFRLVPIVQRLEYLSKKKLYKYAIILV
jgi:hypothetical protein